MGSIPEEHHNVFLRTIPFIAVDNQGVIYASDNRDNIIYKIDVANDSVSLIGHPGQGPGDLNHPWLIYVEGDDLYVADDVAINIFKITGIYHNRFRVYNRLITFAANKDNIFTVESGTEKLITRYDKNGNKLSSFGLKYRPNMSIYKGWPTAFIDGTLNDGKILIGDNAVYFVSYFFGELFKYDLAGQPLTKSNLAEMAVIKKNRDFYFGVGQVRPEDGGFNTFRIIKDAYYFNGKIFILMGNMEGEKRGYEEIVEIDENDTSRRTRLPLMNIYVTASSFGARSIAYGITRSTPTIFVSLYDDKEEKYLINMYKRVIR